VGRVTATFQDAWPSLRGRGWPAFPLMNGTKSPPPAGTTGWDGVDLSGADCAEFDHLPDYAGTRQTAVRMPSTVWALDFDAYPPKTGGRTFTEAARRWGSLPNGPWSSARDDGVSGVRFFRIPDGAVLVPNLVFPELRIGHVEVIQRHHRYAVVYPSIHPDLGSQYTWRGTSGADVSPAIADLPELPQTWLDGLVGLARQGSRALPEQVEQFLAGLPAGAVCDAVRATLRAADAALTAPIESRHDDTCAHVLRILRRGEQGHTGAVAALTALKARFVHVVTADGSRTAASARAEFDRMSEGDNGIGLLLGTPTPDGRRGCRCGVPPVPPTRAVITGILRKVLAAEADERVRLLVWASRKLDGWAQAGQLDPDYTRTVTEQLRAAVRPQKAGTR